MPSLIINNLDLITLSLLGGSVERSRLQGHNDSASGGAPAVSVPEDIPQVSHEGKKSQRLVHLLTSAHLVTKPRCKDRTFAVMFNSLWKSMILD